MGSRTKGKKEIKAKRNGSKSKLKGNMEGRKDGNGKQREKR